MTYIDLYRFPEQMLSNPLVPRSNTGLIFNLIGITISNGNTKALFIFADGECVLIDNMSSFNNRSLNKYWVGSL